VWAGGYAARLHSHPLTPPPRWGEKFFRPCATGKGQGGNFAMDGVGGVISCWDEKSFAPKRKNFCMVTKIACNLPASSSVKTTHPQQFRTNPQILCWYYATNGKLLQRITQIGCIMMTSSGNKRSTLPSHRHIKPRGRYRQAGVCRHSNSKNRSTSIRACFRMCAKVDRFTGR